MHCVASMYCRKSVIHCLLARNFSTFISVGVLVSFLSLFLKYQRSSDLQKKGDLFSSFWHLLHSGLDPFTLSCGKWHRGRSTCELNHMERQKTKWEDIKFFLCNNRFWEITGIQTKTNSVSSNSSTFIRPYLLMTTIFSVKEDKSLNTQTLGETNTFQQ